MEHPRYKQRRGDYGGIHAYPVRFTKEELFNLYVEQSMSQKRICKKYKISTRHIARLLRIYAIPLHPKGIKYRAYPVRFTREELYTLYVTQNLSQAQICKKFATCHKHVARLLREYDIPLHPKRGVKYGGVPRKFFATKDQLITLYFAEGLTTAEIASKLGLGRRTLEDWMRKFGITAKNRSERVSGNRNPFFGKTHTPETKLIISNVNRGRTWSDDAVRVQHHQTLLIQRWADPVYREKNLNALYFAWKRKPTKPEIHFECFCNRSSIPLTYVGNGQFSIGGFNPDFIESSGRKVAVEIFGDYWHTREGMAPYMREDVRQAIFKKLGWDLIVIWEHELKDLESSPNNILKKLESLN